jgi:SAM-dependent methyltransferase
VSTGSKFDTLADLYADARPSYPDALFDALGELAGRPLAGAIVADVGAGTGISSRLLTAHGARVVAVELSGPMLARLLAASPGVVGTRGDGNALPLRDASVDFVTYAQSWHWTDPARAVPEFRRVLRTSGAFAAWWNWTQYDAGWKQAQLARIRAVSPDAYDGQPRQVRYGVGPDAFETGAGVVPARRASFAWRREIPLETHLANLASKSYIGDLGPDGAERFIDAEREHLRAEFPDGVVPEVYVTDLFVVAR